MCIDKAILPKISFIVPCYNVESFLPECVESIISQSYPNWEVILVDDGSTDNTPRLCDDFSREDKRIKVVHKSNGGLVSARNAGFEVASGDWLTYVDGDDWISIDFVEKVSTTIVKYGPFDLLFFCAVQELDGKSISKWDWNQYENGKIFDISENRVLSSHTLNYDSAISDVWAKVFRTEWCREHDIKHNPKLRQGEESVDFVMRAFYHADKSLFIKEHLYHYRFNASSISKRVDENNAFHISECMTVMNDFIYSIPDNDDYVHAFRIRVVYVLIHMAMHTFFNPNFDCPHKERVSKFERIVSGNRLFSDSLSVVNGGEFDLFRRFAFYCIKHKMYYLLELISQLKDILLRVKFFNY